MKAVSDFVWEHLSKLLTETSRWNLLVVRCKPVIVRLLYPLTFEGCAYRLMLHEFVSDDEVAKRPWLTSLQDEFPFPDIPVHRHDWPFSSRILQGIFHDTSGFGTKDAPPEVMTQKVLTPGGVNVIDRWNLWHSVKLGSKTVNTIFLAKRGRYREVVPPSWRPRLCERFVAFGNKSKKRQQLTNAVRSR